MLTKSERRIFVVIAQQIAQNLLAFRERQAAQVVTVQMKKIECEVGDVSLPVSLKCRLQVGEIAHSVLIECDRFAIEDRILNIQPPRGRCNVRHSSGPIQPLAGQQPDRAGFAAGFYARLRTASLA